MTANSNWPGAGCARAFKVQALPGQQAAYAEYVREVVEPIDAIAHAQDAFLQVLVLKPEDPVKAGWTQCRVFVFRDAAHRSAFPALMAKASAQWDGSDAAQKKRKAYADTLRTMVSTDDYLLGA